jgi:DNA-binding helix-hairpin-helix protein with protein kinase domain
VSQRICQGAFQSAHVRAQSEELHTLHSPKSRLQKFPDATWAFLIHAATNIARAVATMHEAGFVIGDVNPKNILVTRQATVSLLDCDSFQFAHEGTVYRCAAGFPEYTPPELHGVAFRDVDRTPQHDAFGLAVVIFQLLFLGRHPFAGKFTGAGEMSLQRAIAEGRLAYGAGAAARQMQAPPGALPWEALPPDVAQLFERSFLTTERAAPVEWIAALDALAQTLKTCAQHSGHRYAATLAACPWCEIEWQARVRLFNVTRKLEAGQSAFRLDEVWREIEQVEAPLLTDLPSAEELRKEPSEAARRVAEMSRNGFILALLIAAAGGLATAYAGGLWAFMGLGWIALLIGHYCLKLESQDESVRHAWPRTYPHFPAAFRITHFKEEAEERVRKLEQRWDWEIGGRFAAKRTELLTQRQHYEALDATRDDRLRQLETATTKDRMQAHLEGFELQRSEVSGLVLTTLLRVNGMKTAADVTPERLKATPGVSRAQTEILLRWRQDKERLLTLEPDTLVHPALRQRVLTETEATRERLEAELRSGAFYLRRLQTEIVTKQQEVRDELLAAKATLAQAEADYQAAGKRRTLAWPVVVLIVAGMVGGFANYSPHVLHGVEFEFVDSPKKAQPRMIVEVKRLFDEALEKRQAQNYDLAIALFEQAKFKASGESAYVIWDELSYTHYLAGNYFAAIQYANNSPHFGREYRPYKNLGLTYAAQGDWSSAKDCLNSAIQVKGVSELDREAVELRYLLGEALYRLDQLPTSISAVEQRIAGHQGEYLKPLYLNFVSLSCFQLWSGDKELAAQTVERLQEQAAIAQPLIDFINNHSPKPFNRVSIPRINPPSKTKPQP